MKIAVFRKGHASLKIILTAAHQQMLEGEVHLFMHIIIRHSLVNISLAFLFFCLGGCASFSKDISYRKECWGGYEYNQEYVLLKDVFLLTDDTKKFFLVPDSSVLRSCGIKSAPKSIKEYRNNPNQIGKVFEDEWKDTTGNKAIGVVDAGTRIKCVRLEKISGISIWWGYENYLDVYGEIIDGPFADFEVNLQDVSAKFNYCGQDCCNDLNLFKPDSRLLR